MVDIDKKKIVLNSQNHFSSKKKEDSTSKSDIRRPITDKRQNKDSKYAGNKIFVLYGMLLLLFIPYFHGNSILENNVVFAQSNP